MSDRLRVCPDVPFRPAGPGMVTTFRCGGCRTFRLVPGRRLLPVGGLRQYVCAACVAQRQAAAGAR